MKYYITFKVIDGKPVPKIKTKIAENTKKLADLLDVIEYDDEFELISIAPVKED